MMSMDMSITLMDDSDRHPNPNHALYYTNSSQCAANATSSGTNGLQLACSGAFASSDHNHLIDTNPCPGLTVVAADTTNVARLGQQRHGQINTSNSNAPCNNIGGTGINYNHNSINNANGIISGSYGDINVHPSTLIHHSTNDGSNHHSSSSSIFNRRVTPYQIAVHGKTSSNYTNPYNNATTITTSNSSSSDNNGDGAININEVSDLYLSSPPSLASPSSCSSFSSPSTSGKYVRYTAEQLRILERLYEECPKPSSARREHLIRHNPPLHHVEPRQIKVWFQNRRCREKQRKETSRLQMVNSKLAMMNKLLMDENVRLQDQVSHLLHENAYLVIQQQQQQQQLSLQHTSAIPNITPHASCDSIALNGHIQQFPAPQPQKQASTIVPCDSTNYPGIVALPEEALVEFTEKPIGPTTSDSWIQMPGVLKVL